MVKDFEITSILPQLLGLENSPFRKDSKLEQFIEGIASCAGILVPLLAVWAIVSLYTQPTGCQCLATQVLYLSVIVFVAGVTVRTVMVDDGCWLVHTASLGVLVVFGVMRRPEPMTSDLVRDSLSA